MRFRALPWKMKEKGHTAGTNHKHDYCCVLTSSYIPALRISSISCRHKFVFVFFWLCFVYICFNHAERYAGEKMCLLLFYVNPEAGADDLYLVLVNVRDEVFTRPTKLARFWENYPNVIGGRDDEPGKGGGTWLAMSKTGRIGALLNILQPDEEILPSKKGRGFLAADYVTDENNYLNYLENIKEEGEKYNSFLLVTMDYSSLKEPKSAFYTNSSSQPPILLSPGVHAFGNSITPNTPWPKVSSAKEYFSRIVKKYPTISTKEILVKDLFSLLQDRTRYKLDESMKKQGKSKTDEFLSKLGAVYVHIPEFNYGSRCHTIILIDGKGSVDFYEKSRPEDLAPEVEGDWILNHHTFKLHGK